MKEGALLVFVWPQLRGISIEEGNDYSFLECLSNGGMDTQSVESIYNVKTMQGWLESYYILTRYYLLLVIAWLFLYHHTIIKHYIWHQGGCYRCRKVGISTLTQIWISVYSKSSQAATESLGAFWKELPTIALSIRPLLYISPLHQHSLILWMQLIHYI